VVWPNDRGALYFAAFRTFLYRQRKGTAMTDEITTMLETRLHDIDLRRAMIEIVLGTLPPNQPFAVEGDDQREAVGYPAAAFFVNQEELEGIGIARLSYPRNRVRKRFSACRKAGKTR
jgi:hypothetical protein